MPSLQDLVRDHTPNLVHALAISGFNSMQYRMRRGGSYERHRDYHARLYTASSDWLQSESERRCLEFVSRARADSAFYRTRLAGTPELRSLDDLAQLPTISKNDLVNHADRIATVTSKDRPIASYTGGTTGASLRVLYARADVQERHATLDLFRGQHGLTNGSRVAWFSGKNILSDRDRKANRYTKRDYLNQILFVSTFDITEASASAIIEDLVAFHGRCV